MVKVNEQSVEDEVASLATDEEGLDTAVVAFFDEQYVRTEERNVAGDGAIERSTKRRNAPPNPFLRG